MIDAGVPYWVAFGGTILIAFFSGLLIQRGILKPLENAPVLARQSVERDQVAFLFYPLGTQTNTAIQKYMN